MSRRKSHTSNNTLHSVHFYSMRDLIDASKDKLAPFISAVISVRTIMIYLVFSALSHNTHTHNPTHTIQEYTVHVTVTCEVCRGKGHFCELCRREDRLVFPFQFSQIARCDGPCKSFFHKVRESPLLLTHHYCSPT